MGVDISAGLGVVISAKQLANAINESNLERVCRLILRLTSGFMEELSNDPNNVDPYDSNRIKASVLAKGFADLSMESDIISVREMLSNMAVGVHDYGSSHVQHSDEIVELWRSVIHEINPLVPLPVDSLFIVSPRYQGFDLPTEEVLLVFSDDACFERVKTDAGKALDEMIGAETELSMWTDYSV